MNCLRSLSLVVPMVLAFVAASPIQAQTSATLNVTARVIEECTVVTGSKRELAKLARKLNDPGLLQRCSKGVVSRVDRRVTTVAALRAPVVRQPATSTRKHVTRRSVPGAADVVLVTVTY